jgi:phospholipase/carboxylesterase
MLIHGSEDTVVDPTETAEAGRALDAAGFDVEAHLLPGLGHGIDQRGLEIAAAFMEKVLS